MLALVLRYEHRISPRSIIHSSGITVVSQETGRSKPLTAATFDSLDAAKGAVKALASDTRISVLTRKTIPSFPAPLFHTLLATCFLLHVSALILSVPRYARFLSPDAHATSSWSNIVRVALMLLAIIPPNLWGLIVIPAVVGLATLVRHDGTELWKYSEHCTIFFELKKEARVVVENVVVSDKETPVVT